MKTVSFTSIALPALALGVLGFVNANSPSEYLEFATDLGLSETDIDFFVSSFGGLSGKNVQQSCHTLKWLFPDNTYLPEAIDTYQAKVSINWSARAWLNGPCIFSPDTTHKTAVGVKVATFFGSQFSIRSGGHTPDPGSASTSTGILFSLENLNKIDLDTTKNILSIGPGCRWGNIYENLEARGFAAVGGRVFSVGVGGLLTGGGLSYFSGTEGFGADNVKSYEVVLANGCVVNASAKENPDLWWALKGGGNNFGIVTRFDIKAIPKPGGLIWGGILTFLPSQIPDVLNAVAKFQAEGQVTDPKAAIIASLIQARVAGVEASFLTLFHQDPSDKAPASLQHFIDIGPVQNTVGNRTVSSLATELYPAMPPLRQLFRVLTIKVSPTLYKFAADLFDQTYTSPDVLSAGAIGTFNFQPISIDMIDFSKTTGGHPLGISREPQVWLSLNSAWPSEKDDDLLISIARNFLEEVEKKAVEMGLDDGFMYLNDAASDQKIMEGYGKSNLERLRTVAKEFDPDQVFQKQVPGGFKLY